MEETGGHMTKHNRVWYEGAVYHVMARGNRRCAIYKDVEDYALFLMLLRQVQKKYSFVLHAFCLMTNHFHLQIATGSEPIWKIMKSVMNPYARTFNQKYGHDGHLFDSRYASCLIEDDVYFLEVSRYIHLNPVKAHMVRDPLAYEYSSYGCYVNENGKLEKSKANCSNLMEELVDTKRVLSSFRQNPREQYRMFVEGKINQYAASVGVVGARRCTQEEKQIAIEKVETEVAGGAAIVSGMAKGIDAYAHTAALLNHGYTIAVLGNGPDICYPKEHETLYEEIIKEGCVLSEYRPGITPHRHLFPQRNRLIAALSDRLYVIGAGRHSGTESTVESARKYRRRVEENGACHH